jgi:predicted nuclease of predicted toxin-antitoxin system
VRFLLNMNLSRDLGRRLAEHGHTYRHARDVGLARATDVEMVETARQSRETILTHDLDYGHLLAFSGRSEPSVVIYRMRDSHVSKMYSRTIGVWSQIEQPLGEWAIVIIKDATLGVRGLPISMQEVESQRRE